MESAHLFQLLLEDDVDLVGVHDAHNEEAAVGQYTAQHHGLYLENVRKTG
jgi:hypothetical protein